VNLVASSGLGSPQTNRIFLGNHSRIRRPDPLH
jgi:hypothetical protein